MVEDKKISLILCFFNEEKYIRYAIDSVLAQTYSNFELIIINDGSTDCSESIIKEYQDDRIVYKAYKENHGLAYARNRGLEYASGEYIGFFDADDILVPDKIEKQVLYFRSHEDVMLVSGGYAYMDSEGVVEKQVLLPRYHSDEQIRSRMLFEDCIACAGAALFRREVIDDHHIRLDETSGATEDYRLWIDMLPYGRFANVDECFFYYRINHGSKTTEIIEKDTKSYDAGIVKLLKKAWADRGFCLSADDIVFMYNFLYQQVGIIKPGDINKGIRVYRKIKKQLKGLELKEGRLILKYYRQQWINTYYVYRVLKDIISKRVVKK